MMRPGWTAVIVNYNGAAHLEACLRSLDATQEMPRDVIVVDNASSDDSLGVLRRFPRVGVLAESRNLGFAGGANAGLAAVDTEFALLLNPDVVVEGDIGEALLRAFAADERLGAAGTLLLYPDSHRVQHAGGVIHRPLMTTSHVAYGEDVSAAPTTPTDVDFVTGGAMGLRIAAFQEIGGFDERFWPAYYEDADLCLRLREAGWRVRVAPSLRAMHHEGVTLGRSAEYFRYHEANRIRFALKHLTNSQWSLEFAPAEFERLRYELHVLSGDDWATRSGATSLETLLRAGSGLHESNTQALIQSPPPNVLEGRIEQARAAANHVARIDPVTGTSHPGFMARVQEKLLALLAGPVIFEQRVFNNEQRVFNNRVVDALEAQDTLNREQMASLMLFAIDVLGRLYYIEHERLARQAE